MSEPMTVRRWHAGGRPERGARFAALVHRYERQIYAHVLRLMNGNADDAAELTQETFLKAYRALDRLPETGNVSAWLHRIAANTCIDEWRRRTRVAWLPWSVIEHGERWHDRVIEDPEETILRAEAGAEVRAVLRHLSPRNREALLLWMEAGLSHREIGAVMGISASAAKSIVFRARREFRQFAAARPDAEPVPGDVRSIRGVEHAG